jgi:hypothetical protein
MSIPTNEELTRFLAPLKGRVTMISFHDKETKVQVINFLTRCASRLKAQTRILDMDAFCSTQVQQLVDVKDSDFLDRAEILLPIHGFEAESLASLITSETEFLIIDDLNSLFSLASARSQSHQLFALMKILSYHARINGSWVFATAYRSVPTKPSKINKHSLGSLADLAIETLPGDGSITLKGPAESKWPDNEFVFGTHLET